MRWFATKQHNRVLWSLAGVMALALMNGPAAGQFDELKLLASDGAADDVFGWTVSISGTPGNEVAIVGAYRDTDNGFESGSAYIYRRSGASWIEEAKLIAFDGAVQDFFGYSVSISGASGNEVAIVGARLDDDNGLSSGSAYIYRFNGVNWVLEAKLTAFDASADDLFGHSVSITGPPGNEVAIVSAYRDDDNGPCSGSAYIYRFDGVNWVEEQKLLASDGATLDEFGRSVSIRVTPGNEVAIVGANQNDDNGSNSGSAYIYRFNGVNWDEEQKLLASDAGGNDHFGLSVSISGDSGNEVAIVGAFQDDDNGNNSGSAYIYRFNGVNWVEEQKLLASDGAARDFLGWSVSISGTLGNEVAIVGAHLNDDNGSASGSAYIYRFNGASWVEGQKLLVSDAAAEDVFGHSVAITGTPGNEVAIVGAFGNDDNGADSGSAYILTGLFISEFSGDCNGNGISDLSDLFLHKTSPDCNDNGIPDECDITSGISVDVDVDGIPDECLASCPPDVNGDGAVTVTDLLALLAAWGVCP